MTLGVVDPVECCQCGRTHRVEGATSVARQRSAARRVGWEPYSVRTQASLDHGPMICPDCLRKAADGALDALAQPPTNPGSSDLS